MAETAAPPPTAPFPEGDPRNAKYFETVAQLEHGYQKSLTEAAELRQNAKTNAEYATGQVAKQEPGGFRNVRNRANNEGLLQSGVLGGRTGTLASSYGARRYSITHGLQEREGQLTRGEQTKKEQYERERGRAANTALGEAKESALNNPTAGMSPAQRAEFEGRPPPAPARAAAARKVVGGKYVPGSKKPRIYQAWS